MMEPAPEGPAHDKMEPAQRGPPMIRWSPPKEARP